MVANGYMDRNVQKAFMPGCIEQSTKNGAHTKHHSIAVCWLDLANAYGSVHHDLIHFSLQHPNQAKKQSPTSTLAYRLFSHPLTGFLILSHWCIPRGPLLGGHLSHCDVYYGRLPEVTASLRLQIFEVREPST